MVSPRHIAAVGCACLYLTALLEPQPALAGTGQAPPPPSMSCAGQIEVGVPTGPSGNIETVNSAADVHCAVPIVTGPVSPPVIGRTVPPSPPIGTACNLVSFQPVTLKTNGTDPRTGRLQYNASWPVPDGGQGTEPAEGPSPTFPVTWQPPVGDSNALSHSPRFQATYDAQVKYEAEGVWTANGCELAPGKRWQECTIPMEGVSFGSSTRCVRATFRGPVTPSQPPGYGLANFDYRQYVQNHVVAGKVMSAPNPDQGLVRIPTYFWIEGMTIDGQPVNGTQQPQPQTSVMRIATPPNALGRSIIYQYVITVGLNRIIWNFGDGSGTGHLPIPNGVGQAYPAHSSVSHAYTTISARGCGQGACGDAGDRYHVTATAVYQVSVNALWFDGATTHSQAVTLPNNGQIELPVTAADVYVGQAQGVPVAS